MEQLLNTIKEKFVQKKEIQKFTKLIEYQTKQMLEEFKSNLKPGINWLIAKKPMGHLCASCEAYLGDLNTNIIDNIIPKNKYSSKDTIDNKYTKLNGGFSKIIQMAHNNDNDNGNDKDITKYFIKKNVKQNISNIKKIEINDENNKKTASNSANYSNIYANISRSNNNYSNNISNVNNDNNSFDDYENDIIKTLPKIKKKTFSASNLQNFDEYLLQKNAFTFAKGKKDKNDFIIMRRQESNKRKKENDLGSPKITKILKKINKNIDNNTSLNNESKKTYENK